jgi:hypothetical protein
MPQAMRRSTIRTIGAAGSCIGGSRMTVISDGGADIATYLPLENTGLSIVPPTWNGNDSFA